MKILSGMLIGMALVVTLACNSDTKAPDVTDNIRHALDSAGLTDVKVSQDRDKNVVTLSGNVGSEKQRGKAERLAHKVRGVKNVVNQIKVVKLP